VASGDPELTVGAPARADLRILGSRFLACASPAADRAAARRVCDAVRAEFPDATHHCFALRLGAGDAEVTLAHDAGEPARTAGAPILQALASAGVTDAVVVVVRWFGGTRLGKGGLARAYREAARRALAAAPLVRRRASIRMDLRGPLALLGDVRHLLAGEEGKVVAETYGGDGEARLTVELPAEAFARFAAALAERTRGRFTASSP
jgi:putative IMPACT (imprinted ancient) family translation regulator